MGWHDWAIPGALYWQGDPEAPWPIPTFGCFQAVCCLLLSWFSNMT
jgi:hypothetical protein